MRPLCTPEALERDATHWYIAMCYVFARMPHPWLKLSAEGLGDRIKAARVKHGMSPEVEL